MPIDPALSELLGQVAAEPWAHDFFALLRRIEAGQGGPRWGRARHPREEPLRLGQDAELSFAPAALSRLETPPRAAAPRLGVLFFGLLGPQGPMPLHFTEHVRARERHHGDPATQRFLDLFHHRLLTQFYRAWAQAQPVVQHDRPEDDRYAAWLGAFAGVQPRLRRTEAPVPDEAWLHQAGLLSGRSAHPEGLAKLLHHHFRWPVRVEPCIGRWLSLEPAERTRLPQGLAGLRVRSQLARLGHNTSLGHKVWDRQGQFRLRLGPLSWADYEAALPDGRAWPALRAWVQRYVGPALAWDAVLVLDPAQAPSPSLGGPTRLGLSTWLGERRRDRPQPGRPRAFDQLVLDGGRRRWRQPAGRPPAVHAARVLPPFMPTDPTTSPVA